MHAVRIVIYSGFWKYMFHTYTIYSIEATFENVRKLEKLTQAAQFEF